MARRVVFLALPLLASCSPMQPVFVINHRDYAVQVVFRNETWNEAAKRHFNCELRDQKPRLLRGTDVGDINWREAGDVASQFHAERCEDSRVLPAMATVDV